MTPSLNFRVLPIGEHERLRPIIETLGDVMPVPDQTIRYVAESEGEIVGCIAGQKVICVSPLWVRKDFRGGYVAERLVREGYELLPDLQKMLITKNTHVDRLAYAIGFKPKSGQLWIEEK